MMKKALPAFFFVLLPLFLVPLVSCKKNNGQLVMQEFAMEDLSPRIEWGLIADPYVACHQEAGYESVVIASFRKGEIYEIRGRCTVAVDDTKELWYAIEDGWIPSSAVKVYSNRLKAEKALKELK